MNDQSSKIVGTMVTGYFKVSWRQYFSPEMLVCLSLLLKSTEESFCYFLNATTYKWWLTQGLHDAAGFNTLFLKLQNQNWSEINAVILTQLNILCRKSRIFLVDYIYKKILSFSLVKKRKARWPEMNFHYHYKSQQI